MEQFQDFLPLFAFLATYLGAKAINPEQAIYAATAAIMVVVIAQVGYLYFKKKPISGTLKFTLVVGVVMGALTLFLRNELFIQWKPTIVNAGFSLALLGMNAFAKTNPLEKLFGDKIRAPTTVWRNITYGWAFGFALAAALNLYVAYNYSLDFWVSYKVFGGMGLTLLYTIATITYLYRLGLLEEPADDKPAAESQ